MSVPVNQMTDPTLPPAATQVDPPALPPAFPLYESLDPTEVFGVFQTRAAQGFAHCKDWRDEAVELYDYQSGRQWSAEDEARMTEQERPMVAFNLMSKFIDVVMGLQINNRQEIRCYPRQQGKAAVNDLASGALAWCRDQCGAEYEETDAGIDTLLVGMGWMEDFYDDQIDPDGVIAQERRDPLEMLWDPSARKKNLTDRRWQIRLKRVSYQEYVDLFDEEPTGSVAVAGIDALDMNANLQIIMTPQDYQGDVKPSAASGKYLIADYQFYCMHKVWTVTAQFPGQPPATQKFSDEQWKQTEPQLKAAGIPHKPVMQKVRQYYRCWITGGGIHGDIKRIPSFTFHAITGKRDRNKNLWFGLGRNLKDPQRWVNAFFSSIIWQLMVGAKGGVMVEESAVADQAKFEDSWSDPQAVTFVEDGAITGGRIQPKPTTAYPEGMDRLMTFSMDALPGVSGINTELLGLTDRQQPGIVEAQRKQGALAIVAWYFDALRRYYQESGRVMLGMIRDFMADNRLIRIAGPEGAQYVPLLRDPLTATFDIIVDEAPTSVNMQERVWAALKEIIPLALTAGVQIPKEVIQYAPIPDDLRQKWLTLLQPSPQQQQAQQQAQQTAQRAAIAKVVKDEAAANASNATATLRQTEAQVGVFKAPSEMALDHVETVRKAAEAGQMMAGGKP